MLVLDYPRKMRLDDPTIVVPAFHAGHLGFLPDTSVNVAVLAPLRASGPRGAASRGAAWPHPEVVISQFSPETRRLAVLSVTLKNDIGVVEQLTRAVSSLKINIELQESTSIDRLNEHHATLLLNMSSEEEDEEASQVVPRNARYLYDTYRDLLPIEDLGLVRVFETVVLHCFDILAWRSHGARRLPAIQLRGLPKRTAEASDRANVQRVNGTNRIRLPDDAADALRKQLGSAAEVDEVTYIFISDTDQRNLRVFFLPSTPTARLFHLAFHHTNVTGALSTILRLVAGADFDIVTSLLRKHGSRRSVWEAVLQYQGEVDPPGTSDPVGRCTQEELQWVADRIRACATEPVAGVACEINLNVPRYPRTRGGVELDDVRIGEGLEFSGQFPFDSPEALMARADEWLNDPQAPRDLPHLKDLLGRVERRHRGADMPTIFLSYPISARHHAELLKEALSPYFMVTDYYGAEPKMIVLEAERRISEADFFIGIWHHEQRGRKHGISPWMPFEWGVARALGKLAIVIHSDKLPKRIWNRIDPGFGNPEYSDLSFADTVHLVVEHCRQHFRHE